MSKNSGCIAAAIAAAVVSVSLISAADAKPCNTTSASSPKPTPSICSMVRPKALHVPQTFYLFHEGSADYHGYPSPVSGRPRQDPLDAWDGYFANPFDNPNYHGSNGG